MLPDVVFGGLRQAIPDRVPAEGTSCLYLMAFRTRDAEAKRRFTISVATNGGTGARPGKDGLSATAYPSGVKGTPVEIVETTTPLLFWRKEFRRDSGGPRTQRGGHGLELEIGTDRPAQSKSSLPSTAPNSRRAGGTAGALASPVISASSFAGKQLEGKGLAEIPAGEHLLLHTPGGGGLGDPRHRDAAMIAADLKNGLISPDFARADYGVEEDLSDVGVGWGERRVTQEALFYGFSLERHVASTRSAARDFERAHRLAISPRLARNRLASSLRQLVQVGRGRDLSPRAPIGSTT